MDFAGVASRTAQLGFIACDVNIVCIDISAIADGNFVGSIATYSRCDNIFFFARSRCHIHRID